MPISSPLVHQSTESLGRKCIMTTTSSVIVAGARTPMGRLLGSLKDLSGSDLGAIAIRGALAKAGVGPELVEYVIMGQVLTAGAGQIPHPPSPAPHGSRSHP